MKHLAPLALAAAVLPVAGVSAQLTGETLAGGFSQPLFVTSTPTDSSVLYVVEKGGRIKTVDADTGQSLGTFLDLSTSVSTNSERGLLGLAFAPDYDTSGEFYVHYTNTSGTSVVARHQRSGTPLVADPNGQVVLQVGQPQSNHNGGWIGFSPTDGDNLYVSIGDGGGGDDNEPGHTLGIGNGQDPSNRLGALLRVDVGGTDFNRTFTVPSDNPFVNDPNRDDTIAAFGLRNGFRASFDRDTGDFYVGDVGQNRREEINLMPDGQLGYNFGWRLREGYIATPTGNVGGPKPTGNIDPIFDYAHNEESADLGTPGTGERPILGRSVTGGYVYRGDDLGPNLFGQYIFGDFVSGRVFALDLAGTEALDTAADFNNLEDLDLTFEDITGLVFPGGAPQFQLSSFGEDADGELYVTTFDGNLTRLDFDTLAGDATYDLVVDLEDFTVLRNNFGRDDDVRFQDADFDANGVVDLADFTILRNNFGTSADVAVLDAWYATVVPEPMAAVVGFAIGGMLIQRRR
jgi:glucose/arabinose dehydrogenase